MGLLEDAERVLTVLCSMPRQKGMRLMVSASELAEACSLDAGRLNEAVAHLENHSWIRLLKSIGSAPYLFSSAQILPQGVVEVERRHASRQKPLPRKPKSPEYPVVNKGSAELREDLADSQRKLAAAERDLEEIEAQLSGRDQPHESEPYFDEEPPDPVQDAVDAIEELKETVRKLEAEVQAAGAAENVDFTRTAVHALSDEPIGTESADALAFGELASSLATILDSPRTEPPLVAIISGPWGSGKSSIANLVAKRLESRLATDAEHPHVVARFNAWMHQDAARMDVALMSSIARSIHEKGNGAFGLPMRFLRPHERLWRVFWYAVLAFLVCIYIEIRFDAFNVVSPLSAAIATLAIGLWLALPSLVGGMAWISSFIRNPKREAEAGILQRTQGYWTAYVNRRLNPLVRVVVFIEDLDRCTPEQAMRLTECANQLLPNNRTIVVLVADMQMLARNVGAEWLRPILPTGTWQKQHEHGLQFMEKIVQLRFEVPRLAQVEVLPFVRKVSMATPLPASTWRVKLVTWLRKETNLWLISAWSAPRKTRNPYWVAPKGLRDLVAGLLWEPLHVTRCLLLLTRYLLAPHDLRPSFRPHLGVGRTLARVGLLFGFILGWISFWQYSYGALDEPRLFLLFYVITLAGVAYPVMVVAYGFSSAIVAGALMAFPLHSRTRKARLSASPAKAAEFLAEQRQAIGAPIPPLPTPVEDDAILGVALKSALEYALTPRMAKRIVTRLRLEMLCLNARQLVNQQGLTPQVVGRWVVFIERWPRLYQEILSKPALLHEWETDPEKVPSHLVEDRAPLTAFFARPTKIGPYGSMLVNYRKAD